MPRAKRMSLSSFQQAFATEEQCREHLFHQRWRSGFRCPRCGERRHCRLSNGTIQCAACHHQTTVTAGTIMHRSHVALTKWFLALYFVSQDKRRISAMQLCSVIGVTYKTAWYLLARIRKAMGQRDDKHQLSGLVELDDAFFGAPTSGKKRGRGTEKAKVFVALSLDAAGKPQLLKMQVAKNIKRESVRRFAERAILPGSTIRSDGYRSYAPALTAYAHEPSVYHPDNGLLRWLHVVIGNAKAFILGTYHGLPKKYLREYLNEFCFRFSRRFLGDPLFHRLAFALADSRG